MELVHPGSPPPQCGPGWRRTIRNRSEQFRGAMPLFIAGFGALVFGLIVGWMASRILRQRAGTSWLSDLIALLGVMAGAAILALLRSDVLFGWYAIGLVLGFFAYLTVGLILYGKQVVQPWRLEPILPTSTLDTPSDTHPAS